MPDFDYRIIRGLLAERRISHAAFARACGLSRCFTSQVLCGHKPGELARIKIERGLQRLSLDGEVRRAS